MIKLLRILGVVVLVAALVAAGHYAATLTREAAPAPEAAAPAPGAPAAAKIKHWSCAMHPQIHLPEKGKCPICFMDLMPVYEAAGGEDTDAPVMPLSKRARELAEIETAPVVYRPLSVSVRMVGKVDYDETRLSQVAAWVPGRIDRLYVDYVGMRVSKGEHLADLYSPDLRTAQEEFLIAHRAWEAARKGGDADAIANAQAMKTAVRKKLELWGILPAQVAALEASGRSDDHMTIFAPTGGTVIARDAFPGKYVQTGERLFTIADLRSVWVLLDAYEFDVQWLRYGQTVEFEADAYPGVAFQGRIVFIQPTLNEATRTVKVRLNVPNEDERLKPGLFVRARVDATLDAAGRVREPSLAGKWMCPMHPEIVGDGPAKCTICGMALVEASTLGYARPETPAQKALSIPTTAALLTGTRAVVYVEHAGKDATTYEGRVVELGPRAGDYTIVRSGLAEGERVVTRGAFKIDASLQILAKPSMMKPAEGSPAAKDPLRGETTNELRGGSPHPPREAAPPAHEHPAPAASAKEPAPAPPLTVFPPAPSMQPVLAAYLDAADALAADDAVKAATALDALRLAAKAVDAKAAPPDAQPDLARLAAAMAGAAGTATPKPIGEQRNVLAALSGVVGQYLRRFGHGFNEPLFEIFCPMAFDNKGHAWFQRGRAVRNPYFGSLMLKCGEVRQEFPPAAATKPQGGSR